MPGLTAQGVRDLCIAPEKGVETGQIEPGHAEGADQGGETTGQIVVAEMVVPLEKIGVPEGVKAHVRNSGRAVQQHSWRKRAASVPQSEMGSFSPSPPPSEKEENRSAFEKKALVPTFPPEEPRELRIREVKPVAGATARASKEKEAASMRTFDERCLILYNELLEMDQEMEIAHMLSGVPEGTWGEQA